MPQICEEGLNGRNIAVSGDDVMQPLFVRDSWFDRLRDACFADVPEVVIEGRSGASRCFLHLLEKSPGQLVAMANWYSFYWLPRYDDGRDPAARAEALLAACRASRTRAHRLTLSPVPTEAGLADSLTAALRMAGWTVGTAATSQSHWLETQGRTFADWWAARPGRLRSTVQRKGKRDIVQSEIHTTFTEALWAEYEAVYAASWKPAESSPEFIRNWARAASAEGALRLGIARIEGRAVAVQFWTVDAGTAHIHKLAQISEDGIEAYSPGTLLTYALFAQAFDADRVTRIDFGTGDDSYKRDWMERSADLVSIVAVDLHQARGWWSLARNGLTRVAARLHKS